MSSVMVQQPVHTPLAEIKRDLSTRGWILLRGEDYSLAEFSELISSLCRDLTFDPARQYVSDQAQKVDAGSEAIGLHIENGNTPLPPDIVAFHSEKSASTGAETTFCDGALVYRHLSNELKAALSQPMTVTRYLPKPLWQRYVATALGAADPESISYQQLKQFIAGIHGQDISPAEEGGVDYRLTITPIRDDNLAGVPAFANALLGPSYNYEKPVYRFADGREVDEAIFAEVEALCAPLTRELAWQDGDVLVLDNKRFMHGRRRIPVPLSQRKLNIGMGSGLVDPVLN